MIGDEPNNTTPLQKLRAALHAKAKSTPNFRFYSLYDKVYRRDVLQAAWEQCRANGGAPGVDGQTFADIEKYGVERWLDELAEELQNEAVSSRSRSGGCTSPSRTGSSGRWGFPRSVTAWCKPPCC